MSIPAEPSCSTISATATSTSTIRPVLEFWYVRRIVDAIERTRRARTHRSTRSISAVERSPCRATCARPGPGSDQTILEIDGDLVDVVEERMDFDRGDDVEIIVGDGRLAVDDFADDSADVVVGDAFGSRAVPFHLATEEFLAEVDRVLRPDGIYVANVIDGARSGSSAPRRRRSPRCSSMSP